MMNYAIVGGGRLARHFSNYFRFLEVPQTRWVHDSWSPFMLEAGHGLDATSLNDNAEI